MQAQSRDDCTKYSNCKRLFFHCKFCVHWSKERREYYGKYPRECPERLGCAIHFDHSKSLDAFSHFLLILSHPRSLAWSKASQFESLGKSGQSDESPRVQRIIELVCHLWYQRCTWQIQINNNPDQSIKLTIKAVDSTHRCCPGCFTPSTSRHSMPNVKTPRMEITRVGACSNRNHENPQFYLTYILT